MDDNYAWDQRRGEDKFYEIDITKVKPAFNQVVISGKNIDNMDIRVRMNGMMFAPEITQVQTEEYKKTFLLKDVITPDALRMEFHRDLVELYEIEVFNV